jgi:2-phosphosulfolactate phosphatase
VSLAEPAERSRLILPSPTASSIGSAAVTSGDPLVVGCLRNALAVAQHVAEHERGGIVPAGERWSEGSLRRGYEEWVGAGAIVRRLVTCVPAVELSADAEDAARPFWRCARF